MARRNSPMDQFLKEAYANVIANQLSAGPTWQDAQQAMMQQQADDSRAQLKKDYAELQARFALPTQLRRDAATDWMQSAPGQPLSYTYTAKVKLPEPKAELTMVKPAPAPAPLTYQEFHDIAAAAIKDYPKIKLVTDSTTRRGGEFVAWLSFGKHESVVTAIKEQTRAEVENLLLVQVRLIRNLVGAEVLQ